MNLIQQVIHLLTHGRSDHPATLASIDEELFEDRERSYGSFELRKNQPWYLLTATGLVLSSVLAVVFVPIWMGWHLPKTQQRTIRTCAYPIPLPLDNRIAAQGQMISCNLLPKAKLKRVHYTLPLPTPENELLMDAEMDQEMKEFNPTGEELGNVWKDCNGCEEEATSKAPGIQEFVFVDQEPIPINLSKVQQQIPFPAGYPSGRVVVRVLVDEEGNTIKHVFIGNSEPLLMEALSPYLGSLKWKPAVQEGKVIPFWVNIPFVFRGMASR